MFASLKIPIVKSVETVRLKQKQKHLFIAFDNDITAVINLTPISSICSRLTQVDETASIQVPSSK